MRALALLTTALLVAAACGGTTAPAPATGTPAPAPTADPAAAVADFYRGKTVRVIVGYSPGGGYDRYARQLAAHIGKHIPGNPTVIVENMDGAGSLKSANYLFTTAPKDGTVFGTFGRGLPATELIGQPEAQFKSNEFSWIGSMNDEVSVCVVRSDRPVKKLEDLYTTTVKVGATGPADDDTGAFPRILNSLLGTKFQVISGYPGGNDIDLGIERGEIDGRCGYSWSSLSSAKANWLSSKFVTVLVQMSLNVHPDIPKDVPLVMTFAKDADQKALLEMVFSRQAMGRPFAAPPGIPAARVAALRDAFTKTMADPAFKADIEKAKLELRPKSGEEIQKIVADIFKTPQPLRDKLKAILG